MDRDALIARLRHILDADGKEYVARTSHLRPHDLRQCLAALSSRPAPTEERIATVADYNAAFDPADEAFGGAFRDGFREGWIYAQSPDGTDYDELTEEYGRSVDIEPSEAWDGFRDKYFAMLPLAAFPEIGKPLATDTTPSRDEEGSVDREAIAACLYGHFHLRTAFDPTARRVLNWPELPEGNFYRRQCLEAADAILSLKTSTPETQTVEGGGQ